MKILFLDTENAPCYGCFWGIHDQNIKYADVEQDWFLLSAQWSWNDEKKVHTISVLDDPKQFVDDHYKADKIVVKKIAELMAEADVVVGHNFKGHDLKKIKAKIAEHRLPALDIPDIVDTYQWSREFGFTSRKLGDLCKKLELTQKLGHVPGVFKLAGRGDVKAIREIIRYGKGDIPTLRELYEALRPYAKNAPNQNKFKKYPCCPRCASVKLQKRGIRNGVQRHSCFSCGASFSDTLNKKKITVRYK